MDRLEKEKDKYLPTSNRDTLGDIDPNNISFFKDNSYFVFSYKKAVKLLKAVYFITESFSFNNSDREELRLLSRKAVKDIVAIYSVHKKEREQALFLLEELEKTILSLLALFEALSMVGSISMMNVAIFIAEYQQILETLIKNNEKEEAKSEMPVFARDFFAIPKDEREKVSAITRTTKQGSDKGQYRTKESNMSFKTLTTDNLRNVAATNNEGSFYKGHTVEVGRVNRGLMNSRSELIVKEVKDKGSVTIKDVSKLMKDVSEKTVQRELIALVSNGVLKKEGERRWSRYSLA